ncbi:MAG: VWA domain-containing protein [Acidobacteria bacterium]|nr:VWA domain-containing protein [Acidobacteriota bacterium]
MIKRFFPLFVLFLMLPLTSFAQGVKPTTTPTPTPIGDSDVVKITTALIRVDVTVTDRKGNVVTDLKPEEVEIFENGEKQKITGFNFISNARQVEEAKADKIEKGDKNGAILPSGPVRSEQIRRTIALVVDDLTLSFESTYYVRRALKKFVDEQMQDGDLVAIIRTGAGIGALQQFTNDRRQLYAAIEKVRWNSAGSGGTGAFAPLEGQADKGQEQSEPEPGERTPEGIEREFNDFRESLFATGTLGAVNYVVRGMQDLPGRKSVMLLSDGFKIFTRDASGNIDSGRVLQSLRRLVDMANRASVVIYTMDARGLQYTGLTAADNTSGRSAEQIESAMSDRRSQLIDTQEGLQYLAKQTGGLAIINNNDLSGGIRRILDDQSYYLVGYEPDDSTFDPKIRRFNRLEVKVKRPGVKVRYRSGFFGVSDEKIVRPPMTAVQKLGNALTSPFALNEISMRLNTLFYDMPRTGPVVRSLVHIRTQDLRFTDEPDGTKKAVFDLLAVGFGDNGIPIDQIAKTYTLTAAKDKYDQLVSSGFVYDFSFPVQKPGAFQFRVALRDHATDKVGSANQFVEVPNLKKNRLVLSGVVLENISFSEWKKREAGEPVAESTSNPFVATSLRQFKQGTVLNWGVTVYNAKEQPAGTIGLSFETRVFRDGKLIFEGKPQSIPTTGQTNLKAINVSAGLQLGTTMLPGDYVLQITVVDALASEKRRNAVQFVQFEVLE